MPYVEAYEVQLDTPLDHLHHQARQIRLLGSVFGEGDNHGLDTQETVALLPVLEVPAQTEGVQNA